MIVHCPRCRGYVDCAGVSGKVACPICSHPFVVDSVAEAASSAESAAEPPPAPTPSRDSTPHSVRDSDGIEPLIAPPPPEPAGPAEPPLPKAPRASGEPSAVSTKLRASAAARRTRSLEWLIAAIFLALIAVPLGIVFVRGENQADSHSGGNETTHEDMLVKGVLRYLALQLGNGNFEEIAWEISPVEHWSSIEAERFMNAGFRLGEPFFVVTLEYRQHQHGRVWLRLKRDFYLDESGEVRLALPPRSPRD